MSHSASVHCSVSPPAPVSSLLKVYWLTEICHAAWNGHIYHRPTKTNFYFYKLFLIWFFFFTFTSAFCYYSCYCSSSNHSYASLEGGNISFAILFGRASGHADVTGAQMRHQVNAMDVFMYLHIKTLLLLVYECEPYRFILCKKIFLPYILIFLLCELSERYPQSAHDGK